jgi:hypothetical protein
MNLLQMMKKLEATKLSTKDFDILKLRNDEGTKEVVKIAKMNV